MCVRLVACELSECRNISMVAKSFTINSFSHIFCIVWGFFLLQIESIDCIWSTELRTRFYSMFILSEHSIVIVRWSFHQVSEKKKQIRQARCIALIRQQQTKNSRNFKGETHWCVNTTTQMSSFMFATESFSFKT